MRPRILVIEKDATQRTELAAALEHHELDADIQHARTRDEAVRRLTDEPFDCAFIAAQGLGADREHILRLTGQLQLPVIIVAHDPETALADHVGAGVTDVIANGDATPDRLVRAARNAIRMFRSEKTAERAESERAALFELERSAREEAETAQQRLAYLAEASSIVSSSLDFSTTILNVARLAVPTLAEWCFVDLGEEDGAFTRVAVAHTDPALADLAARLRRRYPALTGEPTGIGRVIQGGTPEITVQTPDWMLVSVARDAEHLDILRRIGIRSTMCVPLVARGRSLGAMTFVATDPTRIYTMADLAFAEEIARRAALAVENAQLYQDAIVAEERLRHELEFSSAITSSIAEGVIALDADGRITFVNPAASAMLGWDSNALIGRRVRRTFHTHDARGNRLGSAATALSIAVRKGDIYRTDDDVFTQRDGTLIHVSYTVSPIRQGTHTSGAVLVFRDITATRSHEERLRFQANLLEAVGQAVIATDVHRRITYWNPAATTMYGWPPEAAVGRDIMELLVPEGVLEATLPPFDACLKGTRWSGEQTHRRKDGARFPVAVTIQPVHGNDNTIIGTIGVTEDITSDHQAATELERSRRQVAMNEKLSALGTLVSGVAHEIRTPLTYLANNIYLAQNRLDMLARTRPDAAEPIAAIQHYGGAALDAIDRINTLVKDLRAFVQPETGVRTPATLDDVVSGAVELFRVTHRGHVETVADLSPTTRVTLDRWQIQRVAINLLLNAAEAMPSGGTIHVRTFSSEGGAVLEVTDEGIGLKPEDEARIFDPFFTTKAEGTGLGLSITRRIVESHGGAIQFRSRHGQGTTFRVFLPAAKEDADRTLEIIERASEHDILPRQ